MSKRLLKSGIIVSGMTLVSRVLGLVRDVVIAHLIGAGAAADAPGCVRHHLSLRPMRRQGPHHQDPLYRLPGQRLRAQAPHHSG